RPEMDQMLPKPFRLEQLEDAVGTALGRVPPRRITPRGMPAVGPHGLRPAPPARPDAEAARRTVLSGVLDAFGLSSLLIVLEVERPETIPLRLRVPPECAGWRLDHFLKFRIRRLSRTKIRSIIETQVKLPDGRRARPSSGVRSGEIIQLDRPAPKEPPVPRHF